MSSILVSGFPSISIFYLFIFYFFLFGCLFLECWNSFLLRLVPSHPRRASPRAHRVLRVLIERYSESSYRYRTLGSASVCFASFHMGVSTGRSSFFHSDQDAANSGLHPEPVFWMEDRRCFLSFCGVEYCAPLASHFVCFCFCFDTHGCVSLSFSLSFCLSIFLSIFLLS